MSPTLTRSDGRREEFLYWLKLRLRRRKARGPAAGTPRCGRRWRAVLAHPAAPTLYDEPTAEPDLPEDPRMSGLDDLLELRRLDEGGPSRRALRLLPWRTTAHLERVLASTTRPAGFLERLLRGTIQPGSFASLRGPAWRVCGTWCPS
ncbi:hypothetical protein GCM10028802_04170 [Terrabacter terrigena]